MTAFGRAVAAQEAELGDVVQLGDEEGDFYHTLLITKKEGREITHTDFFEDGISGGENSSQIRKAFAKQLGLPELISSSALLKIINL